MLLDNIETLETLWYEEKHKLKEEIAELKEVIKEKDNKIVEKDFEINQLKEKIRNMTLKRRINQRQITLRIVGYNFSSRLTATLHLCPIYPKLLLHVPSEYG